MRLLVLLACASFVIGACSGTVRGSVEFDTRTETSL